MPRRVDDVHLGDAGVGSRGGDDAGRFVTVEYAKAGVAVDVEDFEAFVGVAFVASPRGSGLRRHLTALTFGNGVRMSMRASALLADEGIGMRVVDLRWLMPLPVDDMIREANATCRVLVVDETRHSGGVGEGIVTALVERGFGGRIIRVASRDSYVPLGDAANTVLLSEDDTERAGPPAAQLMDRANVTD